MHQKFRPLQSKVFEMQEKIQKIMRSYKNLLKQCQEREKQIIFLKKENERLKVENMRMNEMDCQEEKYGEKETGQFRSEYLKRNARRWEKEDGLLDQMRMSSNINGVKAFNVRVQETDCIQNQQYAGIYEENFENATKRPHLNNTTRQHEAKILKNSRSATCLFSQTTPLQNEHHPNDKYNLNNFSRQKASLNAQMPYSHRFSPGSYLSAYKRNRFETEEQNIENLFDSERNIGQSLVKKFNSRAKKAGNKENSMLVEKHQMTNRDRKGRNIKENEAVILRELRSERDKEIKEMNNVFSNINKKLEGII